MGVMLEGKTATYADETARSWGARGLESFEGIGVAGRATVSPSASEAIQTADPRVCIACHYLVIGVCEVDRTVR